MFINAHSWLGRRATRRTSTALAEGCISITLDYSAHRSNKKGRGGADGESAGVLGPRAHVELARQRPTVSGYTKRVVSEASQDGQVVGVRAVLVFLNIYSGSESAWGGPLAWPRRW